ncbi:MAG: SUMF1/EgtB/PvdO family nonheme iron enzyme [Pseudomonadota bacterium]
MYIINLCQRKIFIYVFFLIFSVNSFNSLASTQKNQLISNSSVANTKRIALVIGNSAYSFSPLLNPSNDAEDISSALRKNNFEVMQVLDATLEQIDSAIAEFGKKLTNAEVGLFFYAGHGIQSSGRNYIIPVDAVLNKQSDLKYRAVDVGQILDEMAYANSRINIVILDACRNNSLPRSFRSARRGLAIVSDSPKGTFIAYSTAPGKVAADGQGRNSPYSKALISALDKQNKSLEQVFKTVAKNVEDNTGGKQIPWFSSSVTGDFYFNLTVNIDSPAELPTASKKDDLIELKFWESIEKNPSQGKYQLYLNRYPNGYFAAIAQMEITAGQKSNNRQAVIKQVTHKVKIQQCDQLLQHNQLTTGVKGNAFVCYQNILKDDADNLLAKQGLIKIENKYKKWTEASIQAGSWRKAKRYLEKVRQVNPQSHHLVMLDKKLTLEKNQFLLAKAKSEDAKSLKVADEKAESENMDFSQQKSKRVVSDLSGQNEFAVEFKEIPVNKVAKLVSKNKLAIDSALVKQIQKNMLEVKSGCFEMGKNSDEYAFSFFKNASVKGYGQTSEKFNNNIHKVCLTRNFLISKFEVTQKIWQAVMNENPSQFRSCGQNCPVERVSWRDVQRFIKRLNKYSSIVFRLPTEAEWEYIAKAGTTVSDNSSSFFNNYSNNTPLHKCRASSTYPVGMKKPNAWGIYDVYGNVWEWVADWFGNYSKYKITNPMGPGSGAKRVIRGGSWLNTSKECNSYVRKGSPPYSREDYIGFRLAADIK